MDARQICQLKPMLTHYLRQFNISRTANSKIIRRI